MVELLVQATGWDCLQVVVGCFCCWQRWEGWQLQRLEGLLRKDLALCVMEMVVSPESELWERAKVSLMGCSAGPQVLSFCSRSFVSPERDGIQQNRVWAFLCSAPLRVAAWDPLEG